MTASLRVYELAKRHGVDSRTVISALASAGASPVRSASSKLDEAQVQAVEEALRGVLLASRNTASAEAPDDLGEGTGRRRRVRVRTPQAGTDLGSAGPNDRGDLRPLILAAFEAARASGKDDWRHMSTAVLKNRISQILGRSFSEREYGYDRVIDLARDFPDLIEVDEAARPPVLFLLDPSAKASELDENTSIRPDLWRSVIDFSSHSPYFLYQGQAVPASQLPAEPDVDLPLPTISKEEFYAWRQEFARSVVPEVESGNSAGPLADRVSSWLSERRGTAGLPSSLRGRWNQHLKTRVRDRLLNWYATVGSDAPDDLVVGSRRETNEPSVSAEDQLRAALIAAVRSMSYEELRLVQIPAGALLRGRR